MTLPNHCKRVVHHLLTNCEVLWENLKRMLCLIPINDLKYNEETTQTKSKQQTSEFFMIHTDKKKERKKERKEFFKVKSKASSQTLTSTLSPLCATPALLFLNSFLLLNFFFLVGSQ
jgi:hypothetical protein